MPTWEEFESLVQSVNTEEEFESLKLSTEFAAKLIKARLDKNLTQAELAARSGLKQSAIARIENQGSLPRIDTLLKIAKALDMEIDFVLKKGIKEELVDQITQKIDSLENSIKELTKVVNNLQKQQNAAQIVILDNENNAYLSTYCRTKFSNFEFPEKKYTSKNIIDLKGDERYEERYQ